MFGAPASNGFDSTVNALVLSGNNLFVGGDFSEYRGVAESAHSIAKLDATTGELNTTFGPAGVGANGFDSSVTSLALVGTSLFAGGYFSGYRGDALNNALGIAKLDVTSGNLDAMFSPPSGPAGSGFDNGVLCLAAGTDSIFVGGEFTNYRGTQVNGITKLDLVSGAIVSGFGSTGANSGFDDPVYALALVGDALFAGGSFTAYQGVAASASFLAKMSATTGTLDPAFTPTGAPAGSNGYIGSLVPYLSALQVGSDIINCDAAGCVANATRVSQQDRTPL